MKKIIVMQLSRMGDLIMTLPLLEALKQAHDPCHITLISYKGFSSFLNNIPCVDRHRMLEPGELNPMYKYMTSLKSKEQSINLEEEYPEMVENYDLAINLAFDILPAKIWKRVNASKKTGRVAAADDEVRLLGDWMKYLFSITQSRDYGLFHMSDVFIRCGNVPNHGRFQLLDFLLDKTSGATEILEHAGYNGGRLIIFQLGASVSLRTWGMDNFALLGKSLIGIDPDFEITIIGSPEERKIADAFLSRVSYPVIDLVGKTTLESLPTVLSKGYLMISNDTGPIHMAAAVGTPVLALNFASAYFAETAPRGPNNYCIQANIHCAPCLDYSTCDHMNCRSHMTVASVFKMVKYVLGYDAAIPDGDSNNTLYRIEFLGNGTLFYIPVVSSESALPEKYVKGLLFRILWEQAGDIDDYVDRIKNEVPFLHKSVAFTAFVPQFEMELKNLNEIFSVGVMACQKLESIVANPEFDQAEVNKPINQLNIIEGFLDKREEPLKPLKYFFNYIMMDMEYLQFPELAVEMKEKYLDLVERTDRFLHNLRYFRDRLTAK